MNLCLINIIVLFVFFTSNASFSREVFGVLGDAGLKCEKTANIIDSLVRSHVSKLILPGDNLYNTASTYEQTWGDFTKNGLHFGVVALGNHHLSYQEEIDFFGMPGEYYAKKYSEILFLVLNSDNQNLKFLEQQKEWFESQLQNAQEKMIFVVFHHPPVTLSVRHNYQERAKFHQLIRPVLLNNKSKITAVLLGHDHLAGLYTLNGIPLIVSGAAFESYPGSIINNWQDGMKVETKWVYKKGSFWTRLDVEAKNNLVWVNFVESFKSGQKVRCSIKIQDGQFLLRSNCFKKGLTLH